jgi:hypothetical protein
MRIRRGVAANDPDEAFAFIEEWQQLADKYQMVIVCVRHENPGSETGKTRGHLGSQLERKAESNLRLLKEDIVTVIYREKSRGAHIPKDKGPRFHWSDKIRNACFVRDQPRGQDER